jgi:putrescine transport system substrate-binding protein
MRFMVSLLAGAALAVTAGLAAAQQKVVNVYNWSDYIDEKILEDFTKETGIKVVYDVYDSNEIVETKMLAGKTGYDIVVPTNNYVQRLIQAGVLAKLDKSKLPNLSHLDRDLMARMAAYDPGNQHAVIYLWGTTGIGLNAEKIKARMKNPPANSLAMLFDPAIVAKFADCGVTLLDTPDDVVAAALRYLGENPDSKEPAALRKAEEHLKKIRPFIRKFHSSQYINDLANGDICLAFGYSGDILQSKARADEAKKGVKVQYLVPKEGALLWFDSFVIPVDAPNRDNAHAFINYLMNPRVIARASNRVQYPNANKDSLRFVDKEVLADEDIWPKADSIKRLYTLTPNKQNEQRLITRLWTSVKGGS